jgi:DNA-binding PadR family transcriptional regulator
MDTDKLKQNYLPMTETAYYILLSLHEAKHGYGIMQHVENLTEGRINIGAGTMYGTLSKLEKENLIIQKKEIDRKKIYKLSTKGQKVLMLELERLEKLLKDGKNEIGGLK